MSIANQPLRLPASGCKAAALDGARAAFGAPALVLAASYVGFGSMVHELGFGLDIALASTLSAWALPGQVAGFELHAGGASLAAIFLAVALVNARLMPLVVTLLPVLHVPGRPRWILYAAAHLIAITGWALAMTRCPAMPPRERLAWFLGSAVLLWAGSLAGTVAGFLLSGSVPASVSLGLVFVNPIYFLLVIAQDLRERARLLALLFGAALGPPLHLLSPGWGLLGTGAIAGTAAFLLAAPGKRAS